VFEASPEDLMWTPTARAQHSRAGLRYGSAPDRREWAILEPLLPPPGPRGRKRKWTMRQIVSAIFYALRSGCPWDMLPGSFPPPSTVYRWFARFRDDGVAGPGQHRLTAVAVAMVPLTRCLRLGPLGRQVLLHLGVQDPLGQRLLQLVQQPVRGKDLLRILLRQQLLEQLVPDRHTFLHPSGLTV